MIRSDWLWPVVLTISALGAGFVAFWNIDSPLRPTISLWFLIVCPGLALVRLMHLREGLTELAIAIGLSLALETAVNEIMLYAGRWDPQWGLLVVITITLVAVIPQIPVLRRAPAKVGGPQ